MGKRIFISKNVSEIEPYRVQLEAKGYSVIAHSFLSFSPVEFNIERDYDVIFFGSPRAVSFFKASQSISSKALIACVGSKTAEVLESFGHKVDFVGKTSNKPKKVAKDFKRWLGVKNVFFPLSNRSLKTIAKAIPDKQKEEVVIYTTEVVGKKIDPCSVYAFSSPSNVEGFFELNDLPDNAEVIAWGESTKTALVTRGITVGSLDGIQGEYYS